jgi:hypothetical protein
VKYLLPIIMAVVFITAMIGLDRMNSRHEGEMNQRIKSRELVIAELAKQKARVDTQYIRGKTVYLEAAKTWDSVKATLPDSSPVVIAGDKALNACVSLIALCDERNRLAGEQIDSLNQQIKDLTKKSKCKVLFIPCPSRTATFFIGAGLGLTAGLYVPR